MHHKKYGFNIEKVFDPGIIYGTAADTKKIFDMAVGIAPLPRTKLVNIYIRAKIFFSIFSI